MFASSCERGITQDVTESAFWLTRSQFAGDAYGDR